MPRSILLFLLIISLLYGGAVAIATSDAPTPDVRPRRPQPQACGVIVTADEIIYPVNRSDFMLVNPFGRPNQRFDGRLHAGDDYIRIEGETLGEPVVAFAPGRVTYANPTGWGRDRGVVIVEHVFADGVRVYSLYGHIEESDDIQFPASGSCVQAGDVLGVIADPRPAPHLHFEIRTFDPLTPGPGYWPVDPGLEGWLNPRQFIDNRRAWLHPAYQWHTVTSNPDGVSLPPLPVTNDELVIIDGVNLRYLDATGQITRQFRLADSVDAVGLLAYADTVFVATTDGRVLLFARENGLVDVWETEHESFVAGPYRVGDTLVLVTEDAVHFYNMLRQPMATFVLENPIDKIVTSEAVIGIYDSAHTLSVLDARGANIETWQLRPGSDVIAGANSTLYVRDQGDIWHWAFGERELIAAGFTVNRTDAQLLFDDDQLLLWGLGSPVRLTALSLDGTVRWETDVLAADSAALIRARLQQTSACTMTLLSPRGKVLVFDTRNGQLVQQLKLWGETRSRFWVGHITTNNLLRLQIADQIVAYDLTGLTGIRDLYCQ